MNFKFSTVTLPFPLQFGPLLEQATGASTSDSADVELDLGDVSLEPAELNTQVPYEEPPSSGAPSGSSRTKRSNVRRRALRAAKVLAEGHVAREHIKARRSKATSVLADPQLESLPVPSPESMSNSASGPSLPPSMLRKAVPETIAPGEDLPADATTPYDVNELRTRPGWTYEEWNGRDIRLLIDNMKRIHTVLAGRANGVQYETDLKECYDAIRAVEQEAAYQEKYATVKPHRRGLFPVVNFGLVHGNGTPIPCMLGLKDLEPVIRRLTSLPSMRRVAGFQSAVFQAWYPRVYGRYRERLDAFHLHMPGLHKPYFPLSIFPCASINFGGRVWCFRHRDIDHVPYGISAITALGNFNPKTGGHLVLWDLKLIVEFPAGSTILIPSATLEHSNIPIQDGEHRVSLTQYCGGSLLQWVEDGFPTSTQATNTRLTKVLKAKDASTYVDGLGLLSTLDEVIKE